MLVGIFFMRIMFSPTMSGSSYPFEHWIADDKEPSSYDLARTSPLSRESCYSKNKCPYR